MAEAPYGVLFVAMADLKWVRHHAGWLADGGHDTNSPIDSATPSGMEIVIPLNTIRKTLESFVKHCEAELFRHISHLLYAMLLKSKLYLVLTSTYQHNIMMVLPREACDHCRAFHISGLRLVTALNGILAASFALRIRTLRATDTVYYSFPNDRREPVKHQT